MLSKMSQTQKKNLPSTSTNVDSPIPMDTDAAVLLPMDTSNDVGPNGAESGLPMNSGPMEETQYLANSDTGTPQDQDIQSQPGSLIDFDSWDGNVSDILPGQTVNDEMLVNLWLSNIDDSQFEQYPHRYGPGDQEPSTSTAPARMFNSSSTEFNLTTPKPKKIHADRFKELVMDLLYEDFCKFYARLKVYPPPNCAYEDLCDKYHEEFPVVTELARYDRPTIFTEMDAPFHNWDVDFCIMINNLITSHRYLRGDILRVLFDYIMNGPSIRMMLEIKNTIRLHYQKQPPCLEELRTFYLDLLTKGCEKECYFRTCLQHVGVFHHVFREIERFYTVEIKARRREKRKSRGINAPPSSDEEEDDDDDDDRQRSPKRVKIQEVPFDVLLGRHNAYKEPFQPELKQTMDTINSIGNMSTSNMPVDKMKESKTLPRLIEALDLVNDLLEADFLICVNKFKRFIKDQRDEICSPMITRLMDSDNLLKKVLSFYSLAITDDLRFQLVRLIGLMAEEKHLFRGLLPRWDYLNLSAECIALSDELFNALKTCFRELKWTPDRLYSRLSDIRPAWLRHRVTMLSVNHLLNINIGIDLSAIVEIIHMHVKSPLSVIREVEPEDGDIPATESPDILRKKAGKKNYYGETLLHRLCRKKDPHSDGELRQVLALVPSVDINVRDNNGWSPLHEAVYHGATSKVKMLIRHQPSLGLQSVDVGAQNREGITPLHEAVSRDNLEMCKILIEFGGTYLLRKIDDCGVTALDMANDKPEIKNYFLETLKLQENLNLNPKSCISLSEAILRMVHMAAEDLMSEWYTWDVYVWIERGVYGDIDSTNGYRDDIISVDRSTLHLFKKDQEQIRRLGKILACLCKNPKNSVQFSLWYMKYKAMRKAVRNFQ